MPFSDEVLSHGFSLGQEQHAKIRQAMADEQFARQLMGTGLGPQLSQPPTAPALPSSVAATVGALEQVLMRQNELLQALAQRLQPVLRDSAPAANECQATQEYPACALAGRLHEVGRMVEIHNQVLSDVLSRLALE